MLTGQEQNQIGGHNFHSRIDRFNGSEFYDIDESLKARAYTVIYKVANLPKAAS